jgi:hypothetical protein
MYNFYCALILDIVSICEINDAKAINLVSVAISTLCKSFVCAVKKWRKK